jgi:hypothetical protein
VFGLTGLMIIFSIGSVISLSKYLPDDDQVEVEDKSKKLTEEDK